MTDAPRVKTTFRFALLSVRLWFSVVGICVMPNVLANSSTDTKEPCAKVMLDTFWGGVLLCKGELKRSTEKAINHATGKPNEVMILAGLVIYLPFRVRAFSA